MRTARMTRLGVCTVEGCFATTFDDDVCPRCREEIDALAAIARAKRDRAKLWTCWKRPANSDYAKAHNKYAERLRNFAWLVLFLALLNALGWYAWPYVWLIFETWFGGK